jgi:DNA-nicking Smr family endonuclease
MVMNFREILEDWERLSARPGGLDKAAEAEKRLRDEDSRVTTRAPEGGQSSKARDSLASWLDSHGVEDKDARDGGTVPEDGELRALQEAEARRLKAKKPEARIDLHGMKAAEAEAALASFLEACARQGIHSQGEPVLGKAARRVIEACPYAGRYGTADAASGGGGALWVILKKGDYFSR